MGQLEGFSLNEMYLTGIVLGFSFGYLPKTLASMTDNLKALLYSSKYFCN